MKRFHSSAKLTLDKVLNLNILRTQESPALVKFSAKLECPILISFITGQIWGGRCAIPSQMSSFPVCGWHPAPLRPLSPKLASNCCPAMSHPSLPLLHFQCAFPLCTLHRHVVLHSVCPPHVTQCPTGDT